MSPPRILSIAGSDSGGGAGIQADIKTITMLGGFATTAITTVTAQNTLGVSAVTPLPVQTVLAQIDAVTSDIGVDAIKIGLIGSAEIAEAVAGRLAALPSVPVVFDPVMIATSGAALATGRTIAAFDALLHHATLVTPNLDELARLSAMPVADEREITNAAARLIDGGGAGAGLVTGVELLGGAVSKGGKETPTERLLFDLLFMQDEGWKEYEWRGARIDTVHDHGTGCTLSTAIATGLGEGMALADAIVRARAFVRAALRAAPGFGAGHGPMGHAQVDVRALGAEG